MGGSAWGGVAGMSEESYLGNFTHALMTVNPQYYYAQVDVYIGVKAEAHILQGKV